jgi:hypothetical protein
MERRASEVTMFSCKKAARLLSESLDHKLSLWQRISLRIHLAICGLCRHFHKDMHRFDAALQKYAQQIDAGAALSEFGLRPEARQRILQAMEEEKT